VKSNESHSPPSQYCSDYGTKSVESASEEIGLRAISFNTIGRITAKAVEDSVKGAS
jgi:hypothetical protein